MRAAAGGTLAGGVGAFDVGGASVEPLSDGACADRAEAEPLDGDTVLNSPAARGLTLVMVWYSSVTPGWIPTTEICLCR